MKRVAFPVLLALAACGAPAARPTTAAPSSTLPQPEAPRRWTAKDYTEWASTLREDALPRFGSNAFTRACDADNLAPLRDATRPVVERMQQLGDLEEAASKALKSYMQAAGKDASFTREAMAMLQLIVHVTALSWSLSDEFVASLDANDPSYPTRLAGMDRMRLGTTQIVAGSLMLQPPATFWEDAGADWAELVHRTGRAAREHAWNTLTGFEQRATDDATRDAIAKTRRALVEEPLADFVIAKDGSVAHGTAPPRSGRATFEIDPAAPFYAVVQSVAHARESGAHVVVLRVPNDTRRLRLSWPRVERTSPNADDLGLLAIVVGDGVSLKTRGGNVATGCADVGPGLAVPNRKDGARDLDALTACVTKLKALAPHSRAVTVAANRNARFDDALAVIDAVGGSNLDAFPDVRLAAPK